MREKRWLLLALYGILLAQAVSGALKATRPKFKIATTSTTTTSTTEEARVHDENENEDSEASTTVATESNGTTGHTLTGIPQIDYIWDPNLPRELNGYNLSEYPFYNSIPEDIDFKCDGLHDGFYASVPHKCQVYHHCLFGTRYDFLCANFTAFDQKTFICHFVSEVDCANSKKYWHRNDALYKAATTSTTSTTSTTTTAAPVTVPTARPAARDRDSPRWRRPFSRRRPAYDYYDEEYYDDEYSRPRGYVRDDYDYDDRKYRRDRDREFRDRDRDFRERDVPRTRDGAVREDRDRDGSVRDRFAGRNNRRDPSRTRDPLEDDGRTRSREPDQGSRSLSREVDDTELDDRRIDTRTRDPDDRRYADKRFRDDYDDKEPAPASVGAAASTEGMVKPAAPMSSVYSRPRTPPKIRRPVPLSEQDRFAYKATSVQSTEEPRRRPADAAEDDYYEYDLEDARPFRRQLRRRPAYRDRDREFYEGRERDRDRPFRPRYRDDEEDVRPRKHPERSRDRYYDRDRDRGAERGRDRSPADRGKERTPDRPLDRDRGRTQDSDRSERPYLSRSNDRERDIERTRSGPRSKDLPEDSPRRQNIYDRTSDRTSTTTTSTTTTTTCLPEQLIRKTESDYKESATERPERPSRPSQSQGTRVPVEEYESQREVIDKPHRGTQQHAQEYHERGQEDGHEQNLQHTTSSEEYSSEYYDEPEDPPAPPPRTAVRVVKRPFLPSRGGNPNPRGLSPVGSKASNAPRRDEEKATERTALQEGSKGYFVHELPQESSRETSQEFKARVEQTENYDAYKIIQPDGENKQRPDEYDTSIARPVARRPYDRQREEESTKSIEDARGTSRGSSHRESSNREGPDGAVPLSKWSEDEYSTNDQSSEGNVQASTNPPLRGKSRHSTTESTNVYSSSYRNEENLEQSTGPGSLRVKQRINEVTHRLQDIPESEYDVTLNEALTPTLNQESNLPSGFVLPLHRQAGRDTVLQPSENNYKISRPINQQQQQFQQQQQQKPFVPSPQFVPAGVSSNDRLRTVFYRTPETVQISGAQYRPQRGSWHDYTGY